MKTSNIPSIKLRWLFGDRKNYPDKFDKMEEIIQTHLQMNQLNVR